MNPAQRVALFVEGEDRRALGSISGLSDEDAMRRRERGLEATTRGALRAPKHNCAGEPEIRAYICLNRPANDALTGSDSLRCLSCSFRCPCVSRCTAAIALMLTTVPRWICMKTRGSNSSISSLIVFLISA